MTSTWATIFTHNSANMAAWPLWPLSLKLCVCVTDDVINVCRTFRIWLGLRTQTTLLGLGTEVPQVKENTLLQNTCL